VRLFTEGETCRALSYHKLSLSSLISKRFIKKEVSIS